MTVIRAAHRLSVVVLMAGCLTLAGASTWADSHDPGDAFLLMTRHLSGARDARPALRSFERLTTLTAAPGGEVLAIDARAQVTVIDLQTLSKRSLRLRLGPGVFQVGSTFHTGHEGVIEVVGAGRDKTFVRLPNASMVESRAGKRCTVWVRDLTLEGDVLGDRASGNVLGARGACVALFERVRFRGWDDRTGYGAPIGVSRQGQLLAAFLDCAFVGGYRRRMGGEALAVRGSTLHLFERCRFHDMDAAFSEPDRDGASTRSLGLFVQCRFDNTPLSRNRTPGKTGEHGRYPVHVLGGTVQSGAIHDAEPARRRRWNAARALTVSDVAFEAAPVRNTVVDLRKVVERYRAPGGEQVYGAEVVTWYGCRKPFYVVHTQDRRGDRLLRVVQLTPNGLELVMMPNEPVRHPLGLRPVLGVSLRQMLKRSWGRLDLNASVTSVGVHRDVDDNPVLHVDDRLN